MPVMSIIACRILEDEIFHVISSENAFDHLFVTDTKEAYSLIRRLRTSNISHTSVPSEKMPDMIRQTKGSCKKGIIRRICKTYSTKEDLMVVVHVLELGLHRDLALLRRAVYASVEQMSAYSDGILLFYGLCGNSLQNIEKDLSHISCPIYLLRDEENNRVDDCISIALGGNRKYEEAFKACRGKGTLFFTPMWASSWKDMNAPINKQEDMTTIHDSFKRYHISRIVKIERDTKYDPAFEQNVNKFSEMFRLEITSMPGTSKIVERCYADAKDAIKNNCR